MAFKLKKQVKHTDTKWVTFDEETKVLITSIDNPEHQIALARAIRQTVRNDAKFAVGEIGIVEGELQEFETQCHLLAHHIIRGWDGVQDEDGNPLPYTPENAKALLLGSTEAFVFVFSSAQAYAAELKEELEETVGKSSSDSGGKKNSAAKTPKSAGKSTDA